MKDYQQCATVPLRITLDQLWKVEIVTCAHFDAGRKSTTHVDFFLGVQQRNLDSSDLGFVVMNDRQRGFEVNSGSNMSPSQ
jgi:hypothetical protein